MKRFAAMLAVGVLSLTGAVFAQTDQGAKEDVKDAGRATGRAAKKTGRKIKRGTKKAVHGAANKTEEGADKVKQGTEPK